MWVGSRFWGDNDAVLMDVQYQLYPVIIGLLYGQPQKRYLDAARLVQSDSELAQKLRTSDGFDHRTLQQSHDLIAAWFRYSRDNRGERTLFEPEEDYRDRLGHEWHAFFQKEARILSEDYDFVRAVLTAAAFPNPDVAGCVAESRLEEVLGKRYSAMNSLANTWKAMEKVGTKSGEADK